MAGPPRLWVRHETRAAGTADEATRWLDFLGDRGLPMT
jgi:hypothetical protein